MIAGMTAAGQHRIGEFARRVGVNPDLLRAWERRYGVLQPVRSQGGFRLYSAEDAVRVGRMQQGLKNGLSAAEAARAALAGERPPEGLLDDAAERLLAAVTTFDEAGAHAVIDETVAGFGIETVLRRVLLPTLEEIGAGWRRGEIAISQEHFASNVIRGRLQGLARLWGRGGGPLALLACAPGETHDITLLAFGLVLRSYGWRILYLGADTPVATLVDTAATTEPALTVVTSFHAGLLDGHADELRQLGSATRLALAGPGATEELAARIGAGLLGEDLIDAAAQVAAER